MIEKILNTKNTNYTSKLNGDNLRQTITDVFEQRNLSFVGKFTSQSEFEACDKWTYIKWYVPNFKRRTAYLKGEIVKSGKDTLVKLNIKPNPGIALFPILTLLVGLIALIKAASNKGSLIFGLVVIGVGILFYVAGMFLRNRLRNNFKKHLELQRI